MAKTGAGHIRKKRVCRLKGKMVRIHRKPVIAVFGDERRVYHWDHREGAVIRLIRKPESLPECHVNMPG